jgi:hypothetical protein
MQLVIVKDFIHGNLRCQCESDKLQGPGNMQSEERQSVAIDSMLARALPALPQLEELSLQALQLASAEGVVVLAAASALTALSLCDLVFKNDTAARKCVSAIPHLSLSLLMHILVSRLLDHLIHAY